MGIIAQELTDTITIDVSSWNMNSNYSYTGVGSGGGSDTITISNGGSYTIGAVGSATGYINSVSIGGAGTSFNWKTEEFVDCLPDINRVQAMCEQYPGLKIAYEKFVTTYKLVKDDYDSPKD
jgi:hypothetical protein